MEYGCPEKRKSKNDKRAKARFMRYKRGGSFRGTKINDSTNKEKK